MANRSNNLILKSISSFLIISFSAQQLLFAADPREILWNAKQGFEEEPQDRRGGDGAQGEVDQQNALAELMANSAAGAPPAPGSGRQFDLTTANGDVFSFDEANRLTRAVTHEGHELSGTDLWDPETQSIRDVESLKIFSDGTLKIEDGRVKEYRSPDNKLFTYIYNDNGTLQRVDVKLGEAQTLVSTTTYRYDTDAITLLETVTRTFDTLTANTLSESVYDGNGLIKRSIDLVNKKILLFDSGRIHYLIAYNDGIVYRYGETVNTDGSITVSREAPYLLGDFNFDGTVNRTDLAVIASHNGTASGAIYFDGDLNMDGIVGLTDIMVLQRRFNLTNEGLANSQIEEFLPTQIRYAADGKLIQVAQNDGTTLFFDAAGQLTEARDAQGNVIADFEFTTNALGNIVNAAILQPKQDNTPGDQDLNAEYDSQGRLISVIVDKLRIRFKHTDAGSTIESLETEDFWKIEALSDGLPLFVDNVLTNFKLTNPDKTEERLFEGGFLVQLFFVIGGMRILYGPDQKPIKLEDTERRVVYNFVTPAPPTAYLPPSPQPNSTPAPNPSPTASPDSVFGQNSQHIVANIDYSQLTDEQIEDLDPLTAVRMIYDQDYNLLGVVRKNGEAIKFRADGSVDAIGLLDQAGNFTITDEFIYNPADGSFVVKGATTETYYDANDQIDYMIVKPDEAGEPSLYVDYAYGNIYHIYKGHGDPLNIPQNLTLQYTYSTAPDGREITTITEGKYDAEAPDSFKIISVKDYYEGELTTSIDKETDLVSSYTYLDGKIHTVEVTYFGRRQGFYTYSYEDELILVKDEEDIVQAYGDAPVFNADGTVHHTAQNKLVYALSADGNTKHTYSYHIERTENGQAVTRTVIASTIETLERSTTENQPDWTVEDNSLRTAIGNAWVSYRVAVFSPGDLKLDFQARDFSHTGLSDQYTNYHLEILIDGVSKGIFMVPADRLVWQDAEILIQDIAAGFHTLKIVWLNAQDPVEGYAPTFGFKDFKVTHVIPRMQEKEIVTEELSERRLTDGSIAYYKDGKIDRIDLAQIDSTGFADQSSSGHKVTGHAGAQLIVGGRRAGVMVCWSWMERMIIFLFRIRAISTLPRTTSLSTFG